MHFCDFLFRVPATPAEAATLQQIFPTAFHCFGFFFCNHQFALVAWEFRIIFDSQGKKGSDLL